MTKKKTKLEGVVTDVGETQMQTEETEQTNELEQKIAEETAKDLVPEEMKPVFTETQVKQKFLMIGMTEISDKVVDFIRDLDDFTVIQMSIEEMNAVVNRRAQIEKSKTAEGVLGMEENKIRAAELTNQILSRLPNEAKEDFIPVIRLKKFLEFSWSKINNVLATLDMFGHVEWKDEKRKEVKLNVTKEFIIANKKAEIRRMMDLVKGHILSLKKDHPEDVDLKETKKIKSSLTIK